MPTVFINDEEWEAVQAIRKLDEKHRMRNLGLDAAAKLIEDGIGNNSGRYDNLLTDLANRIRGLKKKVNERISDQENEQS